MGKKINMIGFRSGRLTAISMSDRSKNSILYWDCQCSCGNKTTVWGSIFGKDSLEAVGAYF